MKINYTINGPINGTKFLKVRNDLRIKFTFKHGLIVKSEDNLGNIFIYENKIVAEQQRIFIYEPNNPHMVGGIILDEAGVIESADSDYPEAHIFYVLEGWFI